MDFAQERGCEIEKKGWKLHYLVMLCLPVWWILSSLDKVSTQLTMNPMLYKTPEAYALFYFQTAILSELSPVKNFSVMWDFFLWGLHR